MLSRTNYGYRSWAMAEVSRYKEQHKEKQVTPLSFKLFRFEEKRAIKAMKATALTYKNKLILRNILRDKFQPVIDAAHDLDKEFLAFVSSLIIDIHERLYKNDKSWRSIFSRAHKLDPYDLDLANMFRKYQFKIAYTIVPIDIDEMSRKYTSIMWELRLCRHVRQRHETSTKLEMETRSFSEDAG